MSALETSSNSALIKAQITKDDKELREIIKDLTKANAPTKPTPTTRSTIRSKTTPPAAEPQKAILMDIGSGLYGGGFQDFSQGSRPPQVNLPRHSWKPRATARAY
jgi:DNA polymerase gamma 1